MKELCFSLFKFPPKPMARHRSYFPDDLRIWYNIEKFGQRLKLLCRWGFLPTTYHSPQAILLSDRVLPGIVIHKPSGPFETWDLREYH